MFTVLIIIVTFISLDSPYNTSLYQLEMLIPALKGSYQYK